MKGSKHVAREQKREQQRKRAENWKTPVETAQKGNKDLEAWVKRLEEENSGLVGRIDVMEEE